ncbi:MAG: hypothetical protein JWP61_1897 [Friedmanniella sp.]|nr:hypothetical protein [Friedmanniella sp.]
MTPTKTSVLLASAAALTLSLTTALPAAAATSATVSILTTKAKLLSDAAYRTDEHGGKKLLRDPHFEVEVYVDCYKDARSTMAGVAVYTQAAALADYRWLECGQSFVATVPGVKGKNVVTAVATTRYGMVTDTETVQVIAPAVGPAD